jgi:hypothetical protein
MKAITWIVLLCLAVAAYRYASDRHPKPAGAGTTNETKLSANGFLPLPPPPKPPSGKVWVFFPPSCPLAAGSRGRELMDLLPTVGIPCVQVDTINFTVTNPEEADRLGRIMNGRCPIVFVNGRAKNNPTLADIIAEYRQGPGRQPGQRQ